jgi:hypothetical protein
VIESWNLFGSNGAEPKKKFGKSSKSSSIYGGKFRVKNKVEEDILARFRNFNNVPNNQ